MYGLVMVEEAAGDKIGIQLVDDLHERFVIHFFPEMAKESTVHIHSAADLVVLKTVRVGGIASV